MKCATNSYGGYSDLVTLIGDKSVGTYVASGFIICILNIILLFIVLAKLDLPKAISLCDLDSNVYTPIYSWIFIQLSIASLTSISYLVYGGLFSLQIDPCISRTAIPSLSYIFKQ